MAQNHVKAKILARFQTTLRLKPKNEINLTHRLAAFDIRCVVFEMLMSFFQATHVKIE